MDVGNNELSQKMKDELYPKKEEMKNHFKHMCEAGYDPLLCIDRTFNFITVESPRIVNGKITEIVLIENGKMTLRHKTEFIDRIITESRYIDLLETSHVKKDKLDDIIFLDINTFITQAPYVVGGTAAIFWLYPSGCKNLEQLFLKYQKKIQDELRNYILL